MKILSNPLFKQRARLNQSTESQLRKSTFDWNIKYPIPTIAAAKVYFKRKSINENGMEMKNNFFLQSCGYVSIEMSYL